MVIGKLIDWLSGKRENKPLPDALWQETLASLPFLNRLSDDEQSRLRHLAEVFLTQKEFAAAGGLELTDAICVSIAAQGCLPILNLGLEYYRDWVGIVVYPDEFVIPRTVEDEFGVVHEYEDIASGEAWEGGPVLISWHDAQMAGDGYNVVIHEFAHKLDMLNGEADGTPPLPADLPRQEWEEAMITAYNDFCKKVDAAQADTLCKSPPEEDTLTIDPYASETPGEFFAVLSEVFFEAPEILYNEYPALYSLFENFYRQKPIRGST